MGPHGVGKIDGQEKNITTYNLARMNMLLHWAKTTEFDIYHGDTLTNDSRLPRETNPAKMPKFDAIVANPPIVPNRSATAGTPAKCKSRTTGCSSMPATSRGTYIYAPGTSFTSL